MESQRFLQCVQNVLQKHYVFGAVREESFMGLFIGHEFGQMLILQQENIVNCKHSDPLYN